MADTTSREEFRTESYGHIERFFAAHAEYVRDAAAHGKTGRKLSGTVVNAGALLAQSPMAFLADNAAITMAEYALSIVGHMLSSGRWTEKRVRGLLIEAVDRAADCPHEVGSLEWTSFVAGETLVDPANN